MSWFVMLRDQQGKPHPMSEYDEDRADSWVVLFDSEEEAHTRATENMMGRACGFEVYEWEEQ